MCRFVLTAFSVSFLWAGSAQASIGRTQSFQIGALQHVTWDGGVGSVSGEKQGSFTQTQQVSDRAGGVSVRQMERGSLTQTVTASGASFSTAGQVARIRGGQNLLAETTHGFPNRGQQDLVVKLDMRLFQPSGVGTVNGTQNYNGVQEQSVTTPHGTSDQSQSVDVRQSGSIVTQTNVDPTVRNTINISLHQGQVTNGQ